MAPRIHSLALVPPPPEGPTSFGVTDPKSEKDAEGTLRIEHEDGSVEINFNPDPEKIDEETDEADYYDNLAGDLDESRLSEIASQLLDGIQRDEDSRKDWLETRASGIKLLGLKLEEPRGDIGQGSAPLEGMSSVRHPLLLEATIGFQATARGELLPATGPVKIRNDTISKPASAGVQATAPPLPMLQSSGEGGFPSPAGPPSAPSPDSVTATDELAAALEIDMNHYLTVTATEYIPDTDKMLFSIGFGGDGFKKVYNHPLKRRPVSESVDAEDLIISNAAVDLQSCGRVTHRSKMRKSDLIRMQLAGAYLDIPLNPPSPESKTDPVEEVKREITGQTLVNLEPEDKEYTIYEVHCELELDEFAPKKFKNKGLPLPYRVTIEKNSRKVLSIIRRWDEEDDECLPKQFFVQFPFIRGLGFYGLGFIHVLGNTTSTLTACWRLMVDGGMFSNFPAFLYDKQAGRQLTNQFRAPPGGGIPIQVPPNSSIKDLVSALPYKEVGPSFVSFVQNIEDRAKRLAGTADIQIGEGKQDAPVGTTIALIEQATKMLDSVHKRLHWAQAEEFKLLKDRFKENPKAFWQNNKNPAMDWKKEQFLQALENYDLVPVADPNNPTSMHRMAKAAVIEATAAKYNQFIDTQAALKRIFRMGGIDPEGLFRDTPLPPPPDPRMEAIKQKAQTQAGQQQTMEQDSLRKMQVQVAQLVDKAHDRESRERLKQMDIDLEHLKVQQDAVAQQHEIENKRAETIHGIQADRANAIQEMQAKRFKAIDDMHMERARIANEIRTEQARQANDLQMQGREHAMDLMKEHATHQNDSAREDEAHRRKMEREAQAHEQKMTHQTAMHEAKLAHEKALAKVRKSATPKTK